MARLGLSGPQIAPYRETASESSIGAIARLRPRTPAPRARRLTPSRARPIGVRPGARARGPARLRPASHRGCRVHVDRRGTGPAGRSRHRSRNVAWVAGSVEVSRRRDSLSVLIMRRSAGWRWDGRRERAVRQHRHRCRRDRAGGRVGRGVILETRRPPSSTRARPTILIA